MGEITLTIDGVTVCAERGTTILDAARSAGIYIPTLCHHPDLPPAQDALPSAAVYQGGQRIANARPHEKGAGCGLCVVELAGREEPVGSCSTAALNGIVVHTNNDRVRNARREALISILARHPHACLVCPQRDGCSRNPCSANVPENERCCPQLGHCELQRVAEFAGIPHETPRWIPTELPVVEDEPLFVQDHNLCVGCLRCVRACRDLRGIEAIGFVWDEEGRVRIGTLASGLRESGCRFCTACVEVCPTGALADKGVRPDPKAQELVPCREACPARVDVPRYLRRIARGRPAEACAVVRESVPFPGVLGRVCAAPCEEVCRRGALDEAVAICALKRYAADHEGVDWRRALRAGEDTGKRVAVIGAGPAGLTVAFYMRKAGHRVTLYEARDEAGGMMRYGIPPFRLPRAVLEREIQDVLDLGVDFRPRTVLGKDLQLTDLKGDGFDAVFLGVGAGRGRIPDIEGFDLPGVLEGAEFLARVSDGGPPETAERVLVVGGGNTAVDAALTALRGGAGHVTVACLERREDMPAHERQVERALAEGVTLKPSRGVSRLIQRGGRVRGAELRHCERVFDAHGAFRPELNTGTCETVEADRVIFAVGQGADLSFLEEGTPIRLANGRIEVNPETRETDMPAVYAGGDAAAVGGSIVHAVAAARQAASAMDRALGGSGVLGDSTGSGEVPDPRVGREEGFADRSREPLPERDPRTRRRCFEEVTLGYEADAAFREASRCLQCDLRLHMGSNPPPPQDAMPLTAASLKGVPETEGVYRLMDESGNVLAIRGTANLRQGLLLELETRDRAVRCSFEEDPMYSKRESELLQKHLREHGEMPADGLDDLEDLY